MCFSLTSLVCRTTLAITMSSVLALHINFFSRVRVTHVDDSNLSFCYCELVYSFLRYCMTRKTIPIDTDTWFLLSSHMPSRNIDSIFSISKAQQRHHHEPVSCGTMRFPVYCFVQLSIRKVETRNKKLTLHRLYRQSFFCFHL